MPPVTFFYILLVLVAILAPLALLQRRKVDLHWMFLGLVLSQAVAGGAIYFAVLPSIKASAEPAYHDTYYVVASFHALINPVLIPAIFAILTGLAALAHAPVQRAPGLVAFWLLAVSGAFLTTPSLYIIEASGYAQAFATRPHPPFTAFLFRAQNWAGAGYLLSLVTLLLLLVAAALARIFKIGGAGSAP